MIKETAVSQNESSSLYTTEKVWIYLTPLHYVALDFCAAGQ